MSPAPSPETVTIWALAESHAGMRAQADGLAERIAALLPAAVHRANATLPPRAKALPAFFTRRAVRLHPIPPHPHPTTDPIPPTPHTYPPTATSLPLPPPDIVIGVGAAGGAAALAAAHRYGAYAVCIQRPATGARAYHAIIAPRHDYLHHRPPATAILTTGAVGGITPRALQRRRPTAQNRFPPHRKRIAVLIGGDNRAYRLDSAQLAAQLAAISTAAAATLLVTPSRRTPAGVIAHLRARFPPPHYLWDGTPPNPYQDILAAADGCCVTADSVNMLTEACAAAVPLCILPMPIRRGYRAARAARKFAAFHTAVLSRGGAQIWHPHSAWDDSPPPPLAETDAAARQLIDRWRQWRHPSRPPPPPPAPA